MTSSMTIEDLNTIANAIEMTPETIQALAANLKEMECLFAQQERASAVTAEALEKYYGPQN